MSNKAFQELNLSDAFLFAVTMADPEICKDILECILEMKMEQVHVRTEENMVLNPEFRGIRLDVIAADERATHIFLNTRGIPDADTPKALVDFLRFVENTTSEFAKQTKQFF